MSTSLPEAFIRNLKAHFDSQTTQTVLDALEGKPDVSVRLNPVKTIDDPIGQRVPWTKNGYLLGERPLFAQDPRFHAGAYYVQDSSSMIIEAVLEALQPPKHALVLDACAAPGGKSTILLDYIEDEGFLIANEIDTKRNKILEENLLKWGRFNHAITTLSTAKIASSNAAFDLILVDAPCSGEGMFRKDEFARKQWNDGLVEQCKLTQAKILEDLTSCLADDGLLIYATCTMNPHENEEHVLSLIDDGSFKTVTPELGEFSPYLHTIKAGSSIIGHYLLPGISTGEGLFISVLQKVTDLPQKTGKKNVYLQSEPLHQLMCEQFPFANRAGLESIEIGNTHFAVKNVELIEDINLPFKTIGLPYYTIKGKDCVPQHGMAMAEVMPKTIDLKLKDAIRFLKKETLSLPPETDTGWHVVSYKQRHLGWVKALESRTNNYYPGWIRLRT